jgi:glycogen operon protein
MDWTSADAELFAFVRELIGLRRRHPVFRRNSYLRSSPADDDGPPGDVEWIDLAGMPMRDESWYGRARLGVTMFLNGAAIQDRDARGRPVLDDSFLVVFYGHHEDGEVVLPGPRLGTRWLPVVDTEAGFTAVTTPVPAGATIYRPARSVLILRGV